MFTDIKGFIDKLEMSDEIPTSQKNRKLFRELTWSRDQLFKTVSHTTVDETFNSPCTTTGGNVVGAPCMLPVVYPDCTESLKSILSTDNMYKSFMITFTFLPCV